MDFFQRIQITDNYHLVLADADKISHKLTILYFEIKFLIRNPFCTEGGRCSNEQRWMIAIVFVFL